MPRYDEAACCLGWRGFLCIAQKEWESCIKEMGLTLSAAIQMFIAKVGRERRIPFEVSADPFYSDENMERLIRSAKEIETTGGTIHDLSELETV